ncbi:MAG: hypothetical protein WKF37_17865 [Bryobacteraceae bacterium]
MKTTVSMVGKQDPQPINHRPFGRTPGSSVHLNNRLAELQWLAAIEAIGVDTKDVEDALYEFDSLWEQLSGWEQERFIRALVEHVRYDGKTGTVTVGFGSRGIKELCSWEPAL